jgi:hypothetical protein
MTDVDPAPEPQKAASQHGAALFLALVSAALISAIAASLIVTTSVDMTIAGSHRASMETMYSVEAGAERAIAELAGIPDWSAVLASPPSNLVSSFDDKSPTALAPDGRILSIPVLTTARQALSDAVYGQSRFGADSPVWRLFGHAPFSQIVPSTLIAPPGYILVWVADDGGDADGNPAVDSNGQVLVYGDAYGVSGGRRALEVAIGRAAPSAIRVLSWRDPR